MSTPTLARELIHSAFALYWLEKLPHVVLPVYLKLSPGSWYALMGKRRTALRETIRGVLSVFVPGSRLLESCFNTAILRRHAGRTNVVTSQFVVLGFNMHGLGFFRQTIVLLFQTCDASVFHGGLCFSQGCMAGCRSRSLCWPEGLCTKCLFHVG